MAWLRAHTKAESEFSRQRTVVNSGAMSSWMDGHGAAGLERGGKWRQLTQSGHGRAKLPNPSESGRRFSNGGGEAEANHPQMKTESSW